MSDVRLSPGDQAPDFTLTSDTGEHVTLSDLRGGKVIVYFYPAAMTPGCTTQACDFTDSLDSLKGAGYEVLGISPDEPAKLAKFRERDHLTITLLADPGKEALTAYETEYAPKHAELEKQRQQRIEQTTAALKKYETEALAAKLAAWEKEHQRTPVEIGPRERP